MMLLVRGFPGDQDFELETSNPVGDGGEASVYRVRGREGVVAKIYKSPNAERAEKLSYMIAHPPSNPTAAQNHNPYAWPTTLLRRKGSDSVVGFLMPRVTGMKEVFDFYNPAQRRQTSVHFNTKYLMQTARNIAGIMGELHSKGYVVGDVSQRNILVSDAALVTVLDTDSFQFKDPSSGVLHLCRVRTDGFVAPESYASGRYDVERTIAQDLFGLAVLIYHLLMEGVHPFACRYLGDGEPPHLQENVIAGRFAFGNTRPDFAPMTVSPPFEMLAPPVRELFLRAFVAGHTKPADRPSAKEWQRALTTASKDLVQCTRNPHHYFGNHLAGNCPWCGRRERGLPDAFPIFVPMATESRTKRRGIRIPEEEKSSSKAIWVLIAIAVAVGLFVWLNRPPT